MTAVNRRIVLASRPAAEPVLANFRLETAPLPAVAAGQVLVRNRFLSLDPYMRGRMTDARSYAAPQALDAVMIGGTVGDVVASGSAEFAAGDTVVGMGGWQEYSLFEAADATLKKVDASRVPLSAYLGAVGMPGVTAWVGLEAILQPKPGNTLVVSAAAGAVGTIVGQLAKTRGCRVVGIAGGSDKCDYVTGELGFDACIDYKAAADERALSLALKAAAPAGVDCLFENVGGMILDVVLSRMNPFGRIALCGMISGYNGGWAPLARPSLILLSRLKVQGFIVSEYPELWPPALAELGAGVAAGTLRYRETIAVGLDSAPAAFLGLLRGANFGKQLVRLA